VDGVLFDKGRTTLVQYPGGKSGVYSVPATVRAIGEAAFSASPNLTSVTMADTVTNIGDGAFSDCINLVNATIPNSIASIGNGVFSGCIRLSNITVPSSVTQLGSLVFFGCSNLTTIVFLGDAPAAGHDLFLGDNYVTVYYLPGTAGWGQSFQGLPTILWNPQEHITATGIGLGTNRFGFTITGATNLVVVVEACTDLSSNTWISVSTNALINGESYFEDSNWVNYPARFYRLRPLGSSQTRPNQNG
jgi:hypothetical protein